MDKKKIEEAKKKLQEINDIVSGYDQEMRAGAFNILAQYYFEGELPQGVQPPVPLGHAGQTSTQDNIGTDAGSSSTRNLDDLGVFVNSFNHKKAHNNVHAMAAWYYNKHGVIELTRKMIEEAAEDAGVIIPDRSDVTMRKAKKGGKQYYKKTNKGFKPTVAGQQYFSKKYGVKRGNKPLIKGDE